ncbi:unnamed protein product [Spirodela intermedia]|uniref:Uncharacterized protein n=1 Tax=Spirodela intermedia TaxID=51605 RepID=A0A7I8JWR1_SPIIN|nr:unnamed protein product [Spirodela intermedia]
MARSPANPGRSSRRRGAARFPGSRWRRRPSSLPPGSRRQTLSRRRNGDTEKRVLKRTGQGMGAGRGREGGDRLL